MSGPAFDKSRQAPPSSVAAPYIASHQISQADIDLFSTGFARTSKYLAYGTFIGSIAAVPLVRRTGGGLVKSVVGCTAAGLLGGLAGASMGAGRMQADLEKQGIDKKEFVRKLKLFQELTLHKSDPVHHPLPNLPSSGPQPPSPIAQRAMSTPPPKREGFLSSPSGGKPFPFPKFDDRPPPEEYVGFVSDDGAANGDEERPDVGFVPDEKQELGGSRLGDMDSIERATHENPTSMTLLRSRSSLYSPTSSTLPGPSTAPLSSSFETSSTPTPSIQSSSVPSPEIDQPSISLNLDPVSDDAAKREREQREFDRLVERNRSAGQGAWDARGVKKGESVW